MRLSTNASLGDVAMAAGDALRRAGIQAVLTGGACAHLHSKGAYTSRDVDFVLTAEASVSDIDRALGPLGFARRGDRYVHPDVPFFIEFPSGPLGIGEDIRIRPVRRRRGKASIRLLSATDSCRDRLAAFYHWNDRQALGAAVAIALQNRIDLRRVREWSHTEEAGERYAEFVRQLESARRRPRA